MSAMPRLSAFYEIVIYMYRPDHPPPHFPAQYGEQVAQIDLTSLEVLIGSVPARALRLVREWAELHRGELAMNWDLVQSNRLTATSFRSSSTTALSASSTAPSCCTERSASR
jgi:hypothetical protein